MAAVVLVLVTIIIFFAMRLLPGDPLLMWVSSSETQEVSEEQLVLLRHQFGLDRPLAFQYVSWMQGLILHGDMGVSILSRRPVTDEIFRRLPITLHLGITTFILGIVIGVPLGIISAVRRGKWIDSIVVTLSNIGITIPNFWLGLLLMYLFGIHLKWLPIMGYTSPFDDFWLSMKQIIMPVFGLMLFPVASITRQTRSSLLEVMRQDYIRMAWSKGLKESRVILGHALKNGLIPVLTLAGMSITLIVGGAVLIETVFNIPGMGRLAVNSVLNKDYPYVQGIILIISTAVLVTNLIVDIAYGWLDPRIRYS
jgi:peptide/nickel transport system permease protein